jgi:hypothetical protein
MPGITKSRYPRVVAMKSAIAKRRRGKNSLI